MGKRAKKKTTRRFWAFGEPAHVGRLLIGKRTSHGAKVHPKAIQRALRVVQKLTGGGATIYPAQGRYKGTSEPSVAVDMVASGAVSCDRFHARMRRLAQVTARNLAQTSVLAVTFCAGGEVQADAVTKAGHPDFRLKAPRLPNRALLTDRQFDPERFPQRAPARQGSRRR